MRAHRWVRVRVRVIKERERECNEKRTSVCIMNEQRGVDRIFWVGVVPAVNPNPNPSVPDGAGDVDVEKLSSFGAVADVFDTSRGEEIEPHHACEAREEEDGEEEEAQCANEPLKANAQEADQAKREFGVYGKLAGKVARPPEATARKRGRGAEVKGEEGRKGEMGRVVGRCQGVIGGTFGPS